jgi:DNA-binding NarL/FixJ family response regulator
VLDEQGAAVDEWKIMVVDDHPLVREGIKGLIEREPDLIVSAEATGVEEALETLRRGRPDLVIIDLALADGGDGLVLVERIKRHAPALKMLVVSMRDERVFAERVIRAGALGYVSKQAAPEVLIDAVRKVLGGAPYLSPAIAELVLGGARRGCDATGQPGLDQLTNRELQVVRLIGQGLSTVEIAQRLHLSVKTIETHRAKIKRKLGIAKATELVRRAVEWELSQR